MRMRIGISKKARKALDRHQRDMIWRGTGAKTTTVKKPGDQPNATSHLRSVKLNPSVTIIAEFKGPIKKVATTTGVLMIVFPVVDAKTKEILSCKAFGKLAEGILRDASITVGAVVEISGQFNLYRGRLEFVVESGAVCGVPDPGNPSSNPVISTSQSKSEDVQYSGDDGKCKNESVDSAQSESRESEPESSPASLYQCCPNCSPSETTVVDGDNPKASPVD
jgi:hypothetical protein